jgi:hypothetical protein
MFKLCQFNYQAWIRLTFWATAVILRTWFQQIFRAQLTTGILDRKYFFYQDTGQHQILKDQDDDSNK